jgi:hypothetical protein
MSASETPILTNRCCLPHRRLWFGRAFLYADHVCIQGWTWTGRYRRVIPLERIEDIKWWAVVDDVNFMLHLDNGRSVPLQLQKGAGTWNVELHDLLGKSMLDHHTLPDSESDQEVFPSA